ncbi:uncharacterized protein LOC115220998 [Argonauta hians]
MSIFNKSQTLRFIRFTPVPYFLATVFWICLVVICITHQTNACILLLNGWEAAPLDERVEQAEVVVSGQVETTYKENRTKSGTYSADVKVFTVYKGNQLLRNVSKTSHPDTIYRISNFGEQISCFADVDTGKKYIFFLTVYQGHLSGKYDDIFGAADDFSDELDARIMKILGWQQWGDWSPCRRNCNGGLQVRKRRCLDSSSPNCKGILKDFRQCNAFPCEGIYNLLKIFRMNPVKNEEINSKKSSRIFSLSPGESSRLQISHIFPSGFPKVFSLFVTAMFPYNASGYLLALTDSTNRVLLGIWFESKLIRIEYRKQSSQRTETETATFDVDLLSQLWYQFSLNLKRTSVEIYFDCLPQYSRPLNRSESDYTGNEFSFVIGSNITSGNHSHGVYISQLLISTEPNLAVKQCHRPLPNDGESVTATEKEQVITTTEQSILHSSSPNKEQSDNDKCSILCLNGGKCIKAWSNTTVCSCPEKYFGDRCENASCSPGCFNGGECIKPGKCRCQPGYEGLLCQKALCEFPCKNGGECVRPNMCKCNANYTGMDCSHPLCNGGCFHGGICVAANLCSCRPGYTGRYCGSPICSDGCHNGGTCIFPDQCKCLPNTFGLSCEKSKCKLTCLNGGRCTNGRCRCLKYYHGKRCEHSKCSQENYTKPKIKTYRRKVKEEYITKCGSRLTRECKKTVLKYIIVSKEYLHTNPHCSLKKP